MLILRETNKIFLKEDYDKKYGISLNNTRNLVLCCKKYPEFATVSGYDIKEALHNVTEDVVNGKTDGFETFSDLMDYTCKNYIK